MLENKFEKFEQDLTCIIAQKNCAIHTHNWQGGKHCLTTTKIQKRRRQRDKNLENIDDQSLPASQQLKMMVCVCFDFLWLIERNVTEPLRHEVILKELLTTFIYNICINLKVIFGVFLQCNVYLKASFCQNHRFSLHYRKH